MKKIFLAIGLMCLTTLAMAQFQQCNLEEILNLRSVTLKEMLLSNRCSITVMDDLYDASRALAGLPVPRNRDQVEQAQAILRELMPLVENYNMLRQGAGDRDVEFVRVSGYLAAHAVFPENAQVRLLDVIDAFADQMGTDEKDQLKEFARNVRADDRAVRADYKQGKFADEIVAAYEAKMRGSGVRVRFV